jgi:probable rRNA maturation factor
MGYDHQNDSEAEAMEELERVIMTRLRMPDPYLARG